MVDMADDDDANLRPRGAGGVAGIVVGTSMFIGAST